MSVWFLKSANKTNAQESIALYVVLSCDVSKRCIQERSRHTHTKVCGLQFSNKSSDGGQRLDCLHSEIESELTYPENICYRRAATISANRRQVSALITQAVTSGSSTRPTDRYFTVIIGGRLKNQSTVKCYQ